MNPYILVLGVLVRTTNMMVRAKRLKENNSKKAA